MSRSRPGRRLNPTAAGAELPLSVGAGSRFDRRERGPLPRRSILWFLFPLAFAFRTMYDASRQLVPDEAFYCALSRHLSTGYLDHPPMVAYLIRAGTYVFGFNVIGVRIGAAVLSFGAVLVLLGVCRRLLKDDRAVLFLGVIWLCSPLMAALGTVVTPDSPSTFFSVTAMAVIIVLATREPSGSAAGRLGLWTAFGAATGLAMLSKYTAVLPAGAIALALLTTPSARRHLASPGPWVAILVAFAVFSPVVYWNQHHDWASFRFQLNHGLSSQESDESIATGFAHRVASVGQYVAGQFGMWTPVLMIVGLVVTAKRWASYGSLDFARRILVWSATVPLVFFGLAALKSGFAGEANWPSFAYFPMSLLIVDDLHEDWKRSGVKWVRIGIGVALVVSVLLHSPELIVKVTGPKHFPRKLNEFFGWREMGRTVANMVPPDSVLVAGRHQDAGELSFYLPDHPDVWCYPVYDAKGKLISRPTSFDYMADRPNLADVPAVTFIGYRSHADAFRDMYGFSTAASNSWTGFPNGEQRHRDVMSFVRGTPPILIPLGLPPATTEPAATRPRRSGKSTTRRSATQPADSVTVP